MWLDRSPPSPGGNGTGQNFVDAATVEIDDLETPALAVKAFADLRQMTELSEHETASPSVFAVLRLISSSNVLRLHDREVTGLRALENARCIHTGLTVHVRNVRAVADQ